MGAVVKSPRRSIALGAPGGTEQIAKPGFVQGVILDKGSDGLWKLLVGSVVQDARTGPSFPNATTGDFPDYDCGEHGCLFRIDVDPSEIIDVAASQPAVLAELEKLRGTAATTIFSPDRGLQDPRSCIAALEEHRGFWGPWIFPQAAPNFTEAILLGASSNLHV